MLKGVTSGGGGGITPGTTIITGGTNTRVLFDDNGVVGESAGFVYVKATGQATATLLVASTSLTSPLLQAGATGGTIALSTTAGQGPTIAAGTAITAVNAQSITQTWNEASTNFVGKLTTITNSASATSTTVPTSFIEQWKVGSSVLSGISKTGSIYLGGGTASLPSIVLDTTVGAGDYDTGFYRVSAGVWGFARGGAYKFALSTEMQLASTFGIGFASNTTPNSGDDLNISRGGPSQIVFGASNSIGGGTQTSRAEINKSVTGIVDNAATATFTVTIPNGAHSAGINFVLTGSAGAGGAIGVNEFSALIAYDCVVTRTTGANAVATLSAALLTAISASVAGGATPTISAAISAVSGAVGATNMFTLNVTIHAITGSSTNHTCFCYASLMNSNASGVTIS